MAKRVISLSNYTEIVTQYLSGKSCVEISKKYNVDPETIRAILKKQNIPRRSNNTKPINLTKKCELCGKEYPRTSNYFHSKGKDYKDGTPKLRGRCKICQNIKSSKYNLEHSSEISLRNKIKYDANPEYYREQMRKSRVKNIDQRKKYYLDHKESIGLRTKKWRIKNKQKIKEQAKIYRESHGKERLEKERLRMKNDINYRIRKRLGARLYGVLKSRGLRKSIKTLELLGCSVAFLKKHIEELFVTGMSWDNYGKGGWNIDHIKPCAMFDLIKPEEQRKCFHYTNLQPLWETDNFHKNSIVNGTKITNKNRNIVLSNEVNLTKGLH